MLKDYQTYSEGVSQVPALLTCTFGLPKPYNLQSPSQCVHPGSLIMFPISQQATGRLQSIVNSSLYVILFQTHPKEANQPALQISRTTAATKDARSHQQQPWQIPTVVVQLCFLLHQPRQSVLCYLQCPRRNGSERERASVAYSGPTYNILFSAISVKS